MAEFKPSGTFTQQGIAGNVKFTDTSNYDDNDSGVTLENIQSRSVAFTDTTGASLTTNDFDDTDLDVLFTVPKDVLIIAVVTITLNGGSIVAAEVDFLHTRFYEVAAIDIATKIDCNCKGCNKNIDNALKGEFCKERAITFLLFSELENAQRLMNVANQFISNKSQCQH